MRARRRVCPACIARRGGAGGVGKRCDGDGHGDGDARVPVDAPRLFAAVQHMGGVLSWRARKARVEIGKRNAGGRCWAARSSTVRSNPAGITRALASSKRWLRRDLLRENGSVLNEKTLGSALTSHRRGSAEAVSFQRAANRAHFAPGGGRDAVETVCRKAGISEQTCCRRRPGGCAGRPGKRWRTSPLSKRRAPFPFAAAVRPVPCGRGPYAHAGDPDPDPRRRRSAGAAGGVVPQPWVSSGRAGALA